MDNLSELSSISLNKETPTEALGMTITPADSFYTRSHFDIPVIDAARWELLVENVESGEIFTFTLEDLRNMPEKTITVVLECAGNGRKNFEKKVEGEIQWSEGALGNASWTGVPLSYLLMQKVRIDDANVIYFEGLDKDEKSKSKFVRYLPLEKALERGTIIALKMNGKDLPAAHGYPARLVVPGWYAMASLKWLGRIKISRDMRPFAYFNDMRYVYSEMANKSQEPVREIRVKSVIDSPTANQIVHAGSYVTIRGKAWSGSGKIVRVEVRFGNVSEWTRAELEESGSPYSWTMWKTKWIPKEIGSTSIYVKATDEKGNTQPDLPIMNKFLYGYNAITRREILVIDQESPINDEIAHVSSKSRMSQCKV